MTSNDIAISALLIKILNKCDSHTNVNYQQNCHQGACEWHDQIMQILYLGMGEEVELNNKNLISHLAISKVLFWAIPIG